MRASLRALLRSGVLVLVGLAFATTFVVLGIAGVAFRAQCGGDWTAEGCASAAAEAPAPAALASAPPAVAEAAAALDASAASIPPQLSGRDRALRTADVWIDDVFAELAAMPAAGGPPVAAAATAAIAEASGSEPPPAALVPRSVRSVPVDSSGQPVLAEAAAAAAAAEATVGGMPGWMRPAEGAADAALSAYAPVPQARPVALAALREAAPARQADDEAAPAARPAGEGTRTVLGKGANVRSGPSTQSGKVFALAGGAEVSVGEERRGWLHVTDAQGRRGWIYSRYLSRD